MKVLIVASRKVIQFKMDKIQEKVKKMQASKIVTDSKIVASKLNEQHCEYQPLWLSAYMRYEDNPDVVYVVVKQENKQKVEKTGGIVYEIS